MSTRSYVRPSPAAPGPARPDRPPQTSPAPREAGVSRLAACAAFHADAREMARLRGRLMANEAGAALAETFKLLGDVTRVRILDALSRAELCVCDIAALLELSQSAVSHQLRLLRGVRLVRQRRAGRMIYYALDDQHIVELFAQGLRHVEEARGARAPRRSAPAPVAAARRVATGAAAAAEGRK